MNAEQFCYWLQGALELGNLKSLNETQTKVVQDHLNLVFKKVTPMRHITELPVTTFPVPRIGDVPALVC